MNLTTLVSLNGSKYLQQQVWGYSEGCMDDLDRLTSLQDIIERNDLRKKFNRNCLGGEYEKCLIGEITRLNYKVTQKDLQSVNKSGELKWLYNNPDCILTPHYIKWCKQFICDLAVVVSLKNKDKDCKIELLTFIKKTDECDIDIDDIKVAMDRVCKLDVKTVIESEGCGVGAQVFVAQNYCNIENNFRIDDHTCKIAANDYIQKYGCNISEKSFIEETKAFNNC